MQDGGVRAGGIRARGSGGSLRPFREFTKPILHVLTPVWHEARCASLLKR